MAKRLSISGLRVESNQQVVLETFDEFNKPFDVVVPGTAKQGATTRAAIQPGVETAIFRNQGERSSRAPLFAGQIGIQIDTGVMYFGASTNLGDWFAVTVAQTSLIEFTLASFDVDMTGDPPDVSTVQISIATSNLDPLEHPVQIQVEDTGEGDAVDPTHYVQTSPNPYIIEVPAGTPSGSEFNYPITFVKDFGAPPKTIDLVLSVSGQGADLDVNSGATVNLIDPGP